VARSSSESHETGRINQIHGIVHDIRVCIQAAIESDRVAFEVPPSGGIKVPKVVLMQPGLPIEDLSQEAQIVGNQSNLWLALCGGESAGRFTEQSAMARRTDDVDGDQATRVGEQIIHLRVCEASLNDRDCLGSAEEHEGPRPCFAEVVIAQGPFRDPFPIRRQYEIDGPSAKTSVFPRARVHGDDQMTVGEGHLARVIRDFAACRRVGVHVDAAVGHRAGCKRRLPQADGQQEDHSSKRVQTVRFQ
jgi:hypothetical protein